MSKLITVQLIGILLITGVLLSCDGASPPEAGFSADQNSGSASLSVEFTDQSTGEIDNWAWDFDNDGTIDSTQQNPSHVYETPGIYTVSLTVTSKDGSDTVTMTDYINICTPRNHVSWDTGYVSLEADDFYIMADGEKYYANVENVDVHSDPGDLTYCSLELTWEENGVEMRLYIYFYANQTNWWSDEIRTYNGQVYGDWIYYKGMFFKTNIGTAFNGYVILLSDEDNDYAGEIYFENLTLQAF